MYEEHANPPQSAEGFPLSPQQSHLWHWHHAASSPLPRCLLLARIHGPLLPERLRLALGCLLLRHESLRTSFSSRALPLQFISPPASPQLLLLPSCAEPLPLLQARLLSRLRDPAPADVPALRVLLAPDSSHSWLLGISLPELCADGPSLLLLWQELLRFYQHGPQAADSLQEPIQYADFAQWQLDLLAASQPSEPARSFWQSLMLPALHPGLLLPAHQAASTTLPVTQSINWEVPEEQVAQLAQLCKHYDISEATLLLSCWLVVLSRRTGQSLLPLGLHVNGRIYPELQLTIGRFARDLPLLMGIDFEEHWGNLLQRVHQHCQSLQDQQEYFSWEALADSSAEETCAVRFAYEELPGVRSLENTQWEIVDLEGGGEQSPLLLHCRRQDDRLLLGWQYQTTRMTEMRVTWLKQSFSIVLTQALTNPTTTVGELLVLGTEEREYLLTTLNQTSQTSSSDTQASSALTRFAQQVRRTPQHSAVCYEGKSLSYQELETRANQLAQELVVQGIGAEGLVALYLERSIEMAVALLAVWKAGGAYIPLDSSWPVERIYQIIRESGTTIVLSTQTLSEKIAEADFRVIYLDSHQPLWSSASTDWASTSEPHPAQLAYVIYTSGSTGRPKGVMVEHQSLFNYLRWCVEAYEVAQGNGSIVHSPLSFDLTITSILSPLLVGKPVTFLPEKQAIETLAATFCSMQQLSLVKLTPAHLEALGHILPPENADGHTRVFVIGGEALSEENVRFWRTNAPTTRLMNEYGPTETVVGCSSYEIPFDAPSHGPVPIGRPIAHARLYLLDSFLQPVPSGFTGELYIGGLGVARGYLHDPVQTAERFLPDPFHPEQAGARMYRTGDLAYLQGDRELVFLGRNDQQIKIRGFRIEPGEIEATLREHPEVREAAAVVVEPGSNHEQLIAYLVVEQPSRAEQKQTHSGEKQLTHEKEQVLLAEIQHFLKKKLPEYMIPAQLVPLQYLPLTAHGKIDRCLLATVEYLPRTAKVPYVAPRTEVEVTLSTLWAQLLHVEQVGINDNFFELGGHSLLATQLFARICQMFDVDFPLSLLFEATTLGETANAIEQYLKEQEHEEDLSLLLEQIEAMSEEETHNRLHSFYMKNDER